MTGLTIDNLLGSTYYSGFILASISLDVFKTCGS